MDVKVSHCCVGIQQLTSNVIRVTDSYLSDISLLGHTFSGDVFFRSCPQGKPLLSLPTLGQHTRPKSHSASGPSLPLLDPLPNFCILWTSVSQGPGEPLPTTISQTVVLCLVFAVSCSLRLMRHLRTQLGSVGNYRIIWEKKDTFAHELSPQKWPNRVTCLFSFSFLR